LWLKANCKQLPLRKTVGYLTSYIRETFSWKVYGYVALFLILTISLNFTLGIDDYIEYSFFGGPLGVLAFFVLYCLAYYGVAIPILFMVGRQEKLRSSEFWWKSALLIGIMAMRRANFLHLDWSLGGTTSYDDYVYSAYIVLQLNKTLFTIVPLILLKLLWDRRNVAGLYGLSFKRFDVKPYLWFLLGMVPLIAWASFQGDFQEAYPRFKPWQAMSAFGMGEAGMATGFEVAYGLNFVSLELLFRGAMILGMVHLLGKECVLPMVALYASIHFGKPLGECLGSIFGGYILGVFALYSKNIWGGTIIHIGVALFMEAGAYLQHYYNP
jgi:hypothetical protein